MSDGRRDLGVKAADHRCSPIQAKKEYEIAGLGNILLIRGQTEKAGFIARRFVDYRELNKSAADFSGIWR